VVFGDVKLVSIPIKNGEIDINVDLNILKAPIPAPRLTRFPVSQILQNFKDKSADAGNVDKPDRSAPDDKGTKGPKQGNKKEMTGA